MEMLLPRPDQTRPDELSHYIKIPLHWKIQHAFQHDNTQCLKANMTEVCKINCNGTAALLGDSPSLNGFLLFSHPLWQAKQGWGSKTVRNAYFLTCQNRNKWRLLDVCYISTTVNSHKGYHTSHIVLMYVLLRLLTQGVQMTRDHGRVLHRDHL